MGVPYFQPCESRIPLGYLQPQHSSARGWGVGRSRQPCAFAPHPRSASPWREDQPESQRWKGGWCPQQGVGVGWGVSPITGRSPCTGSFLPLETRFFWSKGALGCHSSQGDPADREGGGCGGGHTGVSLPAPPARAPDWPTLSRLNIGLAEGPAPHPHWWSLMLGAPFIECPVCAKHPNNPESGMILSSHTDGCAGSEGSSK